MPPTSRADCLGEISGEARFGFGPLAGLLSECSDYYRYTDYGR